MYIHTNFQHPYLYKSVPSSKFPSDITSSRASYSNVATSVRAGKIAVYEAGENHRGSKGEVPYMCRTRVETVTRGEEEKLSASRGKEIPRALFSVLHGGVCVCVCARVSAHVVGRSQANAQYAAACAHRRIGRPRGDADHTPTL